MAPLQCPRNGNRCWKPKKGYVPNWDIKTFKDILGESRDDAQYFQK
jgi:hypothetical protein